MNTVTAKSRERRILVLSDIGRGLPPFAGYGTWEGSMTATLKVLQVEDDPLDARLLKDMLASEGQSQI